LKRYKDERGTVHLALSGLQLGAGASAASREQHLPPHALRE